MYTEENLTISVADCAKLDNLKLFGLAATTVVSVVDNSIHQAGNAIITNIADSSKNRLASSILKRKITSSNV